MESSWRALGGSSKSNPRLESSWRALGEHLESTWRKLAFADDPRVWSYLLVLHRPCGRTSCGLLAPKKSVPAPLEADPSLKEHLLLARQAHLALREKNVLIPLETRGTCLRLLRLDCLRIARRTSTRQKRVQCPLRPLLGTLPGTVRHENECSVHLDHSSVPFLASSATKTSAGAALDPSSPPSWQRLPPSRNTPNGSVFDAALQKNLGLCPIPRAPPAPAPPCTAIPRGPAALKQPGEIRPLTLACRRARLLCSYHCAFERRPLLFSWRESILSALHFILLQLIFSLCVARAEDEWNCPFGQMLVANLILLSRTTTTRQFPNYNPKIENR